MAITEHETQSEAFLKAGLCEPSQWDVLESHTFPQIKV